MRYKLPIIAKPVRIAVLALLFVAVGCQPQDASKEWKPISDVYMEAWNTGNLDLLDDIIDPQFVRLVGSVTTSVGLDSLKQYISAFRTTYPDVHVTHDEGIYIGDKGAVRWSVTGTNTGPGDFPPTGKQLTQSGISFTRFANGKMVEERVELNMLAWMLQLGFTLTPPPGPE